MQIQNCHVAGEPNDYSSGQIGIIVFQSTGSVDQVKINDNRLFDIGARGIWVDGVMYPSIDGNLLTNVGRVTDATYDAIRIGASTVATVRGNKAVSNVANRHRYTIGVDATGSISGEGNYNVGGSTVLPYAIPKGRYAFNFIATRSTTTSHSIKLANDNASGAPDAFIQQLISGASSTPVTSPTGTDSSTAFASGGKISSVETARFILDTPALTAGQVTLEANIYFNNTGTNLTVYPSLNSNNVNGITRTRLCLELYNNGAGYSWQTMTDTKTIAVTVVVNIQ